MTEFFNPLLDQQEKPCPVGGILKHLLIAVAVQGYVIDSSGKM